MVQPERFGQYCVHSSPSLVPTLNQVIPRGPLQLSSPINTFVTHMASHLQILLLNLCTHFYSFSNMPHPVQIWCSLTSSLKTHIHISVGVSTNTNTLFKFTFTLCCRLWVLWCGKTQDWRCSLVQKHDCIPVELSLMRFKPETTEYKASIHHCRCFKMIVLWISFMSGVNYMLWNSCVNDSNPIQTIFVKATQFIGLRLSSRGNEQGVRGASRRWCFLFRCLRAREA
jgi:hypothetical protein